jgi:hypothetical protein
MEQFEEIGKIWENVSDQLRNKCINYIKQVCRECDPEQALYKDYYSINFEDVHDKVSCTYYDDDEGTSNEVVRGINYDYDRGMVFLTLEYDGDVNIDLLPTHEIYCIARYLRDNYLPSVK